MRLSCTIFVMEETLTLRSRPTFNSEFFMVKTNNGATIFGKLITGCVKYFRVIFIFGLILSPAPVREVFLYVTNYLKGTQNIDFQRRITSCVVYPNSRVNTDHENDVPG